MLLFVMQPDLDDRSELGQVVCQLDEPRDRVVDMTAISGDFIGARTRDQTALRPRVAWTGRYIIGIVEIGEALVEGAIILGVGPEQKLLEKPAGMGAMPLGWARVRHRLHDLVFGGEQCRPPLGFGAHAAECLQPI